MRIGSRHTGRALAAVLLAAAVTLPAVGAGPAAARKFKSISYSGTRGQVAYASFVIRGHSVVGLFVGGACLPNISLIEDGTDPPIRIRGGAFVVHASTTGYRVTMTAKDIGTRRYRVSYTLRNLRAKATCAYTVIARRTTAGGA